MKKLHISVVDNREYREKFQREKRLSKMEQNRVDPYYNKEIYEAEQHCAYGIRRMLFDQLPQMAKDFTVGFNLYEQLPNVAPFLLESAAYRVMLLIANKDDNDHYDPWGYLAEDANHYHLDIDILFTNGIVDNLIECCRSRYWPNLRHQATMSLYQFILEGTNAQNQELLRHGVVPSLMQLLNDEETIDLDDEHWLNHYLVDEALRSLALLSAKLDVGGDLVRAAFVEQNLCGRLMLLFRNPTESRVANVLTFVENFLTRGSEDQIQVLLDNQVLHHLGLIIVKPMRNDDVLIRAALALGYVARRSIRWRDLVLNSGADLLALFRILRSLGESVNVVDPSPAIRAVRTIGYLCFGSPSPPFDKLRPALPVLWYLINDLELRIENLARPAIKHACLIIACLARGGLDPINGLIDENMCPGLVMLLAHPDSEVVASVMKVVENFLTNGTANQIQVLHGNQVLQHVLEILINHDNLPPLQVRSVCRSIANIATYSEIQSMVEAAIFPSIIEISINQEAGDTKYEATYAISSAVKRGSYEQIRYLVDNGAIAAISGSLLGGGYCRRASCFQGLRVILRVGETHKVDGVNVYRQMVTENGGLARIKSQRDDADIGEMARRLLNSYWHEEV